MGLCSIEKNISKDNYQKKKKRILKGKPKHGMRRQKMKLDFLASLVLIGLAKLY